MSLAWTEAPAAHAAQIYTESDELAESVAAYFAAGFDDGEPAILVATSIHTSLVLDRLAAIGWDAKRIDALGLLASADADATLEQFMDGALPADAAFERVVGGLLDELASRFPETRIRVYGEMVDVLCRRGQQNAAVALEELWNRLARTRRFALLCGYRLDVFDRQTQVETLRDVCNLHTHVASGADDDRLAHAVDDALVGVLGAQGAGQVYSLVGAGDPRASCAVAPARPAVGQREHADERGTDSLGRTDSLPRRARLDHAGGHRRRRRQATRVGRVARALRKATRTRRLS